MRGAAAGACCTVVRIAFKLPVAFTAPMHPRQPVDDNFRTFNVAVGGAGNGFQAEVQVVFTDAVVLSADDFYADDPAETMFFFFLFNNIENPLDNCDFMHASTILVRSFGTNKSKLYRIPSKTIVFFQEAVGEWLRSEIERTFLWQGGKDAANGYETWHPDIVLLDVYMPQLTGFSVLKHIRRQAVGDNKTAMATSVSKKDDILQCMKLGVQGYIIKPFGEHEIAEKVQDYYGALNADRAMAARAEMDGKT